MQRILEDMSDEELVAHIRGNLTGGHMSYEAARGELLRRATLRVSEEVRKFNARSTWFASVMIVLTIAIAVLTAVMIWK